MTICFLEIYSPLNVNTTLLVCMLLAEYYGNHLLNLGRHSRCVFALLHPRNLKIKPEPRKTLNKKRKKRKQVARSWSPRYFFLSLYLFLAPLLCLQLSVASRGHFHIQIQTAPYSLLFCLLSRHIVHRNAHNSHS